MFFGQLTLCNLKTVLRGITKNPACRDLGSIFMSVMASSPNFIWGSITLRMNFSPDEELVFAVV
jgi:hypothetical protein